MKKILDILIGILIGLAAAGVLFLTTRAPAGQKVELMPTSTPKPIMVFVIGAVKQPGVYAIPYGSRVADAVTAAGGFLEGADVMNINLALTPLISLIAGILILVIPRLLNYIVALYLIVIGLIGLFGGGNFRF